MPDDNDYADIIELLRLYRDLEGVSTSGERATGHHGNEGRMLYMPGGDWDRSGCDKLDELLRHLRAVRPGRWWHLTERYLRCDVRARRVKLIRTHSGNLRLPPAAPCTEYLGEAIRPKDSWLASEGMVVTESWSPRVNPDMVELALEFLDERFPRRGRLTQVVAA